ncbi:MAG: PAS domain-containing protein, partial [Deltaproteobacteria bacterium]|nr:PAS domain-containing protein [Deltaproteobacteria bacterium]
MKMIPCPAGLWTQDRSLCLLNAQAISLLGFQDSDFDDARHLWAQQVHAGDRDRYLDFSRRVGDNHGPRSCDYRFLPKGAIKHVSLRETSDGVTTVTLSRDWQVISTYIEISDLKSQPPVNGQRARLDDIIDELFHDAQNGIHRVGMELELARMGLENGSDAAQTTEMINVLEHTVRDLRGYI